ncbi:MAG: hypothetical protein ACRDF0_05595 [Candidatus Limnocylindria bacterium]
MHIGILASERPLSGAEDHLKDATDAAFVVGEGHEISRVAAAEHEGAGEALREPGMAPPPRHTPLSKVTW